MTNPVSIIEIGQLADGSKVVVSDSKPNQTFDAQQNEGVGVSEMVAVVPKEHLPLVDMGNGLPSGAVTDETRVRAGLKELGISDLRGGTKLNPLVQYVQHLRQATEHAAQGTVDLMFVSIDAARAQAKLAGLASADESRIASIKESGFEQGFQVQELEAFNQSDEGNIPALEAAIDRMRVYGGKIGKSFKTEDLYYRGYAQAIRLNLEASTNLADRSEMRDKLEAIRQYDAGFQKIFGYSFLTHPDVKPQFEALVRRVEQNKEG